MKLQNVLRIYICMQLKRHRVLILHLTADVLIGNKTKHTYTMQKINQTSHRETSESVSDIGIFSPKYRNIGHRKFSVNRLTLYSKVLCTVQYCAVL